MENEFSFNFDELLTKFCTPILILLTGAILTACGVIYFKSGMNLPQTKVEVLNATTSSQITGGGVVLENFVTVEISGQVINPGVYKLGGGSRVDDLLTTAGGLTALADRTWTDKYLNRAAKLTDSQKLYIPKIGEQLGGSSAKSSVGDQSTSPPILGQNTNLVNINTSSLKELDSLPGIGPTYAQNIIEHRPYSTLEELVSKGAIKQNLFEKIKDKISVY